MYKAIIVDDEDLFRENLIKKVNWSFHNILIAGEANDGKKASFLINEINPQIVICDIKMPVMDGISLLKQLPAGNGVKFIILSGHNDFEFTRQAIKYGAFDYILKPIDEDEISGVLMRAVESLDNNIERNTNNVMMNIELRKKMLDNYESLIIHFVELKDITSIYRYIEDFYDNFEFERYPDAYYTSYTEFVVLANKICSMFKLDSEKIIKSINNPADFHYSQSQKQLAAAKVKKLFMKIVDELVCSKNSEGKKIISEVIEYIETNFSQKISLEIISKKYFINPSYFSQLFKSVTSENFSTYLITKRVEIAKKLLEMGSFKIYQVSEMVGYEDEKHFSQIFKKITGKSPSEYAK